MGRNADKRKARKQQTDTPGGAAPDGAAPAATDLSVPSGEAEPVSGEGQPAWSARLFGARPEVPSRTTEGSLARALFHMTCLIAAPRGRAPATDSLVRVAVEVASMISADTVTFLQLQPGDDLLPARLTVLASHGLQHADVGLVRFDLGDGIAGQVALTGEAVRVEDAPRDPRFSALYGQRTEIGSLLAVPLRYGKRVIGVLAVSRREVRGFHESDEEMLGVIADSIAQDLEQTRLMQEASTDALTGLFSRQALIATLAREVECARRYQTGLALMLLDIDGLREVNETAGRPAGDRVLMEIARRIAARVRGADLPVRFGGDEFAVLLPMTEPEQAVRAADRLRSMLVARERRPSLRIGVVTGWEPRNERDPACDFALRKPVGAADLLD